MVKEKTNDLIQVLCIKPHATNEDIQDALQRAFQCPVDQATQDSPSAKKMMIVQRPR